MLESIKFPEPVISVAIEPKSKADSDKMGEALAKLSEEDPTFHVASMRRRARQSSPAWASCTSRSSSTACCASSASTPTSAGPRWPTARRCTQAVKAEGRFVRQTGGRGQYGVVELVVEPRERGAGFLFENKTVGGSVPKEYVGPTEAGVKKRWRAGPSAATR